MVPSKSSGLATWNLKAALPKSLVRGFQWGEATEAMRKNLLCLSWLNGQLKAVAVQGGSGSGTWERPGLVVDFSDVSTLLAEAVEKTQAEAKEVGMVLAHPRLGHQVVEVPPAKGGKLERFLQRRVEQLKTFEGAAAWTSQPAMPIKNSNALLLHIFPKSLVDQLVTECEADDLQLIRLLPTTAVLSTQLKQLPLEKDELTLLVAETGSTTTVVIGRSDGRVCLGRVLRSRSSQQLDALALDLTRTIRFAEQESGLVVSSVWLFGAGAQTHVPALQPLLHLPVKVSPVKWTPFYWAEQAAKLPEINDGNLVSLERRQAPQRRRLLTMTGLILLILLVVSLATAGYCEFRREAERTTIRKENADQVRLQEQKADWQRRLNEWEQKKELVRLVSDEKPPPVSTWFLGYLSEAVPSDLVLTELRVARTNQAWSVMLAGVAQPTTNASPAVVFRQAFAALTNNLVTGSFHLNVKRSVMGDGAAPATAAGKGMKNTFLIEGVLR